MAALRLIERAAAFADRTAVRDAAGAHTFADLLVGSERRARGLLAERADLEGERVAFLVPPGFEHVATLWSIWRAGGVAVPLAPTHPTPELARLLADARPALLLADEALQELALEAADRASDMGAGGSAVARVETPLQLDEAGASTSLPAVGASRRASMVYTSGTASRPKGVVTTHANVAAQISTLVEAWEWTPDDHILHVLPLHHVHGIINALSCALWSGACCEFQPPDPVRIWECLSSGEVSLFMAVPTLYGRLIAAWGDAVPPDQRRWSAGAGGLRLMVSGSAALPRETLERWEHITGHRLLERYGMTEIGMALGNPLHGERRAGTVGSPFSGVEARVVDDDGSPAAAGQQGEIEVRGEQVFLEYWDRPAETEDAFTGDGWFRTGDEAVVEDGYWSIVGRRGVDIIKTGGYKVSALEIEAVMRRHPGVADVAVVGVVDEEWGERVCAAVVAAADGAPSAEDLRAWCKHQMAPYKVPKQLVMTGDLPRNSMGKTLKPDLRRVFTDAAPSPDDPA